MGRVKIGLTAGPPTGGFAIAAARGMVERVAKAGNEMMRAKLLIVGLLLATPALAGAQGSDDGRTLAQWRAAAARGDAEAMFQLGQAYKLGRGVPADARQAQDYYRQAAQKGHAVAADNYGLALFQNGRPREAVPYLEKASQRGDARAQYVLGTMLFNGVDVRRDWVRAYALLTRSQRSGLPQANKALAQMEQHIAADDRRKGLAMADRLPAPARAVTVARRDSATPPPSRIPAAPAASGGGWRVQLGAFGNGDNARRLGGEMAARFPGQVIDYVAVGALTKVLVGRYPSRAAAIAACGSVQPCVPVGP